MTGGNGGSTTSGAGGGWDFFVSYTAADRAWAEWIAWQLEEAGGFRVLVQAWDMVPGTNFVVGMQNGVTRAARTVAVLSEAYTRSQYGTAEWQAAWAADPTGIARRLLVVRVEDCPRPGILGQVVSFDLFDRPDDLAREELVAWARLAVSGGRAKPAIEPAFPGSSDAASAARVPALPDKSTRILHGVRADTAASLLRALEGPEAAAPGVPVELLDNPVDFGVGNAIAPEEATGLPRMPIYVPRVHDAKLRMIVQQAVSGTSRIAVLVGDASSGKSRAGWEVLTSLPVGWRVWHPISPRPPEALLAELAQVVPKTAIWLDDAHDYLLAASAGTLAEQVATGLRELLRDHRRRPVLVLATTWREEWTRLISPFTDGQAHRSSQARMLLTGHSIIVPTVFSPNELDALRDAARDDTRLADALEHAESGQIVQYLAAAPVLQERYGTATAAARRLVETAMDARRLGHGAELPADLLRSAAPGYLNDQEWNAAGRDWFIDALSEVTAPCRGADGMLIPVHRRPPDEGPSAYRLAGFLDQHGRTTRRASRVPATLWEALLAHASDGDALSLAASAGNRLLHRYAIPLFRRAADAGEWGGAYSLGSLLLRRGDVEGAVAVWRAHSDPRLGPGAWLLAEPLAEIFKENGDIDGAVEILRAHADVGEQSAAHALSDLLAERGDLETLRNRADAGEWQAASRLAPILAERGEVNELRARTDRGDVEAASKLAGLLAEHGDPDEAINVLRVFADKDSDAAVQLAGLLINRGRANEAIDALRKPAEADWYVACWLAHLHTEQGETQAALDVLRPHARTRYHDDDGFEHVGPRLAELLVASGNIDELRERADAGDGYAEYRLDEYLADSGDLDALRTRAQAGRWRAARRLADLGDADGAIAALRRGADVGDLEAAVQLADLLAVHRSAEEAIEALYTALNIVSDTDGRDIDEDVLAAAIHKFEDLLEKTGGTEALRSAAEQGDIGAADRLSRQMADRGDFQGAVQVIRPFADNGDVGAALWLVKLIVQSGDLDALRARVDEGDWYAADQLPRLLATQGRHDDARCVVQFGLNPDGSIATGPSRHNSDHFQQA